MSRAHSDGPADDHRDRYRALFAVSDAIASHRDLSALFHELASRLARVVQFNALSVVLHDPTTDMMRRHILEASDRISPPPFNLPPDDDPAGMVWRTQQPIITSQVDELSRWPRLMDLLRPYAVQSMCYLPLTTSRRRLGALVFVSRQRSTYQNADTHFLQLVANQAAVAVENALAFQEIEALKDKLAKEKAYLEEEVRTEHNFGDIVGESSALHDVLKKVATVADTDSTVLVCGEGAVTSAALVFLILLMKRSVAEKGEHIGAE